jgi:hypothetical protein
MKKLLGILLLGYRIIVLKQLLLFFVLVFYSFSEAHSRPPYDGTIFYFKDVINSKDPSSFQEIVYAGQDNRTMFDRRKNDWIKNNAYLFNASYDDGLDNHQVYNIFYLVLVDHDTQHQLIF